MSVFANFLIFQAGWFATVLGAANGAPWLGPIAVLVAVVLHLWTNNDAAAELRLSIDVR